MTAPGQSRYFFQNYKKLPKDPKDIKPSEPPPSSFIQSIILSNPPAPVVLQTNMNVVRSAQYD
jgi:hypothetical protein